MKCKWIVERAFTQEDSVSTNGDPLLISDGWQPNGKSEMGESLHGLVYWITPMVKYCMKEDCKDHN